jgi:hypothetical protein
MNCRLIACGFSLKAIFRKGRDIIPFKEPK